MNTILDLNNVSMRFIKSGKRVDTLKEYLSTVVKVKYPKEDFWALKDITFKLNKGDSLGIIGSNGSGKSTLLKVISGIFKPTCGSIHKNGNIAPLIELWAGFDYDLSARDNIFLNGALLGYSRKQIKSSFEEIVHFTELEDFIDTPLKNFSSGMLSRLGFGIATISVPDILIIDEALSVGDYKFMSKSLSRIQSILSKGTTLLFVSHSNDQVIQMCNKALWLDQGKIKMLDSPKKVCTAYMEGE